MEAKKWYVLKTTTRAEKQVSQRLSAIGIDNYLPLQSQLKKWHDRKRYIDVVLFKSYVFVRTTESERLKVFEVAGISRYLFVSGTIAVVTENEIEQIKIFCAIKDIKINKGLKSGDEVEIIAGKLSGFKGTLISSPGKQQVQIHIPVLNCFANIQINKSDIVRAI